MGKITVMQISVFLKYQWVGFLALYWGLRIVGKAPLSQKVSHLVTFILLVSLAGWVVGAISRDREMTLVSQRVMRDASVSLILLLTSMIVVILWVFVEFDGIQAEYVIKYLMSEYGVWITLPIACLICDRQMQKKHL